MKTLRLSCVRKIEAKSIFRAIDFVVLPITYHGLVIDQPPISLNSHWCNEKMTTF